MKKTKHSALRWVLVTEANRAVSGALVRVGAGTIRQLRKVLRMEWGDEVNVLDGGGRAFQAKLVEQADSGAFELGLLIKNVDRPPLTELVVFLPKNSTMDWIVEKAVECGVTKITPVVSRHSVVKPDYSETEKYVHRWQAIMDGALEQSEQLWRAEINPPQPFEKWIETQSQTSSLFVFASELRRELVPLTEQSALAQAWQALDTVKKSQVGLVVGPEGGFSYDERQALMRIGCKELSLGPTVLRVETAVVFILALLRMRRAV